MSTQWWKIHPCISLSKRKKFPKKKRKYIYIYMCVCVCGWGGGGCVCRAVHGSGRSSLCPTHSRLVGDRVGRCQTRNRSVLGSGFTGRFPVGWGQNLPERTKKVENWRDLSWSVQDPVRSSWIWQRFRQIRYFFPQIVLRIAGSGVLVTEICQITLENLSKSLKS